MLSRFFETGMERVDSKNSPMLPDPHNLLTSTPHALLFLYSAAPQAGLIYEKTGKPRARVPKKRERFALGYNLTALRASGWERFTVGRCSAADYPGLLKASPSGKISLDLTLLAERRSDQA